MSIVQCGIRTVNICKANTIIVFSHLKNLKKKHVHRNSYFWRRIRQSHLLKWKECMYFDITLNYLEGGVQNWTRPPYQFHERRKTKLKTHIISMREKHRRENSMKCKSNTLKKWKFSWRHTDKAQHRQFIAHINSSEKLANVRANIHKRIHVNGLFATCAIYYSILFARSWIDFCRNSYPNCHQTKVSLFLDMK